MASDKPKTVRGTLYGAKVETSEENAERLGSAFEPESKSTTAKRTTAKAKSDDEK